VAKVINTALEAVGEQREHDGEVRDCWKAFGSRQIARNTVDQLLRSLKVEKRAHNLLETCTKLGGYISGLVAL
jgi:hypothetical protein